MAETLTEEQIADFKYTFELFDEDHNGSISAKVKLGNYARS